MGIEGKHSDTGGADVEIHLEGAVEYGKFLLNGLFGNRLSNLAYGQVSGDQCHAEIILHQDH